MLPPALPKVDFPFSIIEKRWDGSGKTVWFECLMPPERGGSRFRTVRREPRP